ncbi:MAG: hypothetical protein JW839_19875, partial [Candidatus Lokiarchaeota archaeon]|nr:hypothetical protein [Candidatus Lokiarchaeota archaeon]
ACGRTGMGAVWGSKKLKAIAVRGTGKPHVEHADRLAEAVKTAMPLVKGSLFAGVLSNYGTPANYSNEAIGDVPIKNYQESRWKGNKSIDHEALLKRKVDSHGCFSCPVRCTGIVEYEGRKVRWPEYETLAMLGSQLLVDDLDTIIKWNVLVDDLGIDTISLGACVAGLLEAIEKKLLKIDPTTLGFEPGSEPWGNKAAIELIFGMISRREGIGDDLADGIKRFVEKHGLPAAMSTHGKGLEVPAHEPRANNMTALDYFTEPRGAYHCNTPMALSSNMNFKKELGLTGMIDKFSTYSADGKEGKDASVEAVVKIQDAGEAYSACGGCIFGFQVLDTIQVWIDALNAITGRDYDVNSWMAAGETIFNLKRSYNVKCGITRADDTVGSRFFTKIEKGGTKKNVPPIKKLLPRYYEFRGWTQDGVPTETSWVKRPKVKPRRVIDYIADMLVDAGLTTIIALPGGSTPFLMEEFYKRPEKFTTIVPRHEGAGTAMADAIGRITRKPAIVVGQGVWMATNGGFGIAESFFAGNPMVVITEFSDWFGLNHFGSYQLGNGEWGAVDLRSMFKGMAKFVTVASEPAELYHAVQLAIKHSMASRPGPAVVISKWNTMMGLIDDPTKVSPYPLQPLGGFLSVEPPCISRDDAQRIAAMLVEAEAPVMICGRGSHAANAYDEVAEIAGLIGMPVATSYMGKGIVAETHDLAVGSTGAIGQRLANRLVGNADLILAVGTCLAPDNTRNCSFDFINPKYQKIVQIDIEPRNAGWTYPITLGVHSDAKLALRMVIEEVKALDPRLDVEERIQAIKDAKADPDNEFFHSKFFLKEELPLDPERVVKSVNSLLREQDLLLLDAGNNRMFFTKLFQTKRAGQLVGPGGAAGMGWCAGAALGAQLVHKSGKVVGVMGDGGMLMMLHCLVSAKQYNLPVVYVVMNNSSLGNPRDYLTTSGRKSLEYEETDFAAIANSMGVKGYKVKDFVEFEDAFKAALLGDAP